MKRKFLLFILWALCFTPVFSQPLVANFSGTPLTICAGDSVSFTDLSTGGPNGWMWTFQGGTPDTSFVQNPVVTYSVAGVYDVTLQIFKGFLSDVEFKNNYITVIAPPPQPGTITGDTSVCAGQSGVAYFITAVAGATSYTWTVPAGASVTTGQGTTSVIVTFGSFSGNICVTANDTCGQSAPRCVAVAVDTVPTTPGPVSGLNLVCPNQTGLPFNIAPVSGATSYAWTVPAGAIIVSGQGTTSISVNWGTTSGNVCVTAINNCGTSSPGCFSVTVITGPPPAPGAISGPDTVCANAVAILYSILPVDSAAGYFWTVPAGATITSGQGTTSITVTFGISPGSVCVMAVNGCGSSATNCKAVTVNSPPSQPGIITGPTTVCSLQSGVAYSILVVPGATSYTWTVPTGAIISSGQGTTSISVTFGSASGNICVTANNACPSTASCNAITVISTPATPGTITGLTSVCTNQAGVTYSVSPVAGATSYAWNVPAGATVTTGQGTTSITITFGTSSGNVCVTASNSCGTSPSNCLAVTVNPGAPATPGTITGLDSVCANQAGVTYSIAAVTGAAFYTWTVPAGATIISGQGTTTIAVNFGFSGGSVCVTAGNGCGTSASICKTVVTTFGAVPPQPGPITGPSVVCPGQSSVSYSISPVSGATFYNWTVPAGAIVTSGQGTTSVTVSFGTNSGNICVTAGSSCGTSIPRCLAVSVVTLSLTTNSNDASTCTTCDGSAWVTVTGGTTPYSFLWNTTPSQSNDTITGLCPADYTVSVTDSAGCFNTATETVNPFNSTLNTNATSTNETACGACNGTATVTPSGGKTPYTYLWNTIPPQTDSTATGLCPGTYTVTVTDADSCTDTRTRTINPAANTIVLSTTKTNETACNACNGTITVSASGGTSPYSYLWNTTPSQTTSTVAGLCPGTYAVTVTDSLGCIATTSRTINPFINTLNVNSSSTAVTACGTCDGTATAIVSGGTSPYTYLWNTNPPQTTSTATGLCAGLFTVTVTDSIGCTRTRNQTVNPPPSTLTLTSTKTDETACNACNGTITVTASGGTPPYSYLWNTSPAQTTSTATGLCPGNYVVSVTDSMGCTRFTGRTINPFNNTLNVNSTSTLVTSCAVCNGTATAAPSGGTSPYTYLWNSSPSQTTSTATGLCAGNYTVTVTDSLNCKFTKNQTVNSSASSLALTSTKTDETACGACNGTVSVTASGGVSPYTYLWNTIPSKTTSTVTGLCPGNYSVTVTDSAGCERTTNRTINQWTNTLTLNTLFANESFCGMCNGSGTATVSGGTPAYAYLWSNSQTTSTATGLCAGNYTVTVTDTKACTDTGSINITCTVCNLTLSTSTTNTSCSGSTGTASVVASGGVSPYTYLWNDSAAQTIFTATGLSVGTFMVIVTDSTGCKDTAFANVSSSNAPALIISATKNVSCNGGSNGSVTVTASGGTTPYSYLWSNGQTSSIATGLSAGNYNVTVTGNNGCASSANTAITQPPVLNATVTGINVSCNGMCNGSATVSASGGTTPYSYLWNDPGAQSTVTASGLCAGNYSISVTDSAGCVDTAAITINAPALLSIAMTSTNPSCNGGNNGTATVTVSGGTTAYSYLWSGGGTSSVKTGLSAGSYTVTVTDSKGCTNAASVVISNPPGLVLTLSKTNSTCGSSNGSATVSVSGGTTPYSYAWSTTPVKTTATATGLFAGSYTVTVTDSAGCTNSGTITINDIGGPAATISSSTNVSCNGGNNGTAAVAATGGSLPYIYNWSNGQTISTATGLSAGNYSVTVTDSSGCAGSVSVTITQPTLLTAAAAATAATCNGLCNGSATANVTGGTSPYSYIWNDTTSQNTQTANGLCAGTYNVTVTDTKGCTSVASTSVNQPTVLAVSAMASTPSCSGSCNASASASVTGGTTPYSYNWGANAGLQTTQTATGLCAGTYSVTVTDANGCTKSSSVIISDPAGMTLTTSSTNAICGNADGSATVSVAGGTTPYIYTWSTVPVQSSAIATGLAAGSYTVTVTDSAGCTKTGNAIVNNTGGPAASISSSTNVSCNGGANGSAAITASGGTTPYSYLWGNGQTSSAATGLSAGNYNVTVTDSAGCKAITSVTITQPSALIVSATGTNVSCNGGSNGTATATSSGGSSPYTYLWNNAASTAAATATGLAQGTYTVTVTDANGCTKTASVTLSQPAVLSATMSSAGPSCNGSCNANATANPSGGTLPYSYLWSTNAGSQATQTAVGLCAGTYTVTVTDANGCAFAASIIINNPTPIILSFTNTNTTCGNSNGSATVSASGGITPYSYSWSDGKTTSAVTGLAAGAYSVTVTGANGCTASGNVNINSINGPSVSISSSTNASCNGGSNGTAAVAATGGSLPYLYNWSNGQTISTATGLSAGNYSVTVTDSSGCAGSASVTITQPTLLTAAAASTAATCNGFCNGSATASVSGGTSPYSYLWGDTASQNTPTAVGLCVGTYNVTITDAKGCTSVASTSINQPPVFSVSAMASTPSCSGSCDASATAVVTGGTTPYSYQWGSNSGLQSTQTATGLCAGTHTVAVTDSNGCNKNASVIISDPAGMTLTISVSNSNCGNANGSATVSASGGTTPYGYSWSTSPVQTFATATGLAAGSYTVTVTDSTGCTKTGNVSVNNTGGPTATISAKTNVSCNGGSNGSATVSVSGGTSPFIYNWSNGQTSSSATGISAGSYIVTVTANDSCSAVANVTITQPSLLSPVISSQTNASCNGTCNGQATVSVSGGTSPYAYLWNTTPVQTAPTATGLCSGNYKMTVTDINGCTDTIGLTITQPASLNVIIAGTSPACDGKCNGSAAANVSGGIIPYTYLWNDPAFQTTPSAVGLCAGTYTVTITDNKGCSSSASVVINNPAGMVLTTSNTNSSCGSSNGSATVTVSGGASPYSYSWNNGVTSASLSGLAAGNYTVTVTDSSNCSSTVGVSVNNTGGPSVSISSGTNVACNGGNNGSSTVSATGGATPYSYLWSNGQTSSVITGLTAGTYNVTVTDSIGCVGVANDTVTQPPALVAVIASKTNVSCTGTCNGTASVAVTGGTTPYSYLWSTPNNQTTLTATGLCNGTYTVTSTDNNGCTVLISVTIFQPSSLVLTASSTNATCGTSDGTATVTVSGGTMPYTYLWSTGGTNPSQNNLSAGTYTVTVKDSKNCTQTTSITVNNSGSLSLSMSASNVACYGMNNGSATLTASGGSSPYTYLWSNGNTTSSISNLTPGVYTITLTDSLSCTKFGSAAVSQPDSISLTKLSIPASCPGSNNGSAAVSVSGGISPYTYLWSTGGTISIQNSLTAGTYTVTVKDSVNCTKTTSVTIITSDSLALATTASNVTCNGMNNGTATVIVTSGTSPYTYLWSGGGTTSSNTGLVAGTYTVTLTDSLNCTISGSVIVTQPDSVSLTASSSAATCQGGSNGTAAVAASGGSSPYTYLWSTGATSVSLSGLAAGIYTVIVTDNINCSKQASTAVGGGSTTATISPAVINGKCNLPDGQIILSVSGGKSPYSYLWNTGAGTQNIASLPSGYFSVTVTDSLGCKAMKDSVQVTNSGMPVISSTITDASCELTADATIDLTITGNAPYTFLWSDNSTKEDVINRVSGKYSVTVTDSKGCTVTGAFEVKFGTKGKGCFTIPTVFTPNGDGINDVWRIRGLENFPDIVIEVYNEWGDLLFQSNGYKTPWDGNNADGKPVPSSAYYYIIMPGNGENQTGTITIVR